MKIGIEVEGRLRGVKTLFCGPQDVAAAKAYLAANPLTHVYISDRDNTLDYVMVGWSFPACLVTMDVTSVREGVRPTNVTLILTLPHSHWDNVARLRADDQVKFHSVDREVLCATARNFVPTQPAEFLGDVAV